MMTNEYWCFCQSYIVLLYFQHYGSVMYGWARTSFIAYCIYSLAGRIQVYWTDRTRGGNETGEHQVFEFYDIKRQASEKNMLPDHKWRGEVFLKVVRLLSCIRWTRSSINTYSYEGCQVTSLKKIYLPPTTRIAVFEVSLEEDNIDQMVVCTYLKVAAALEHLCREGPQFGSSSVICVDENVFLIWIDTRLVQDA
jgi:hypothetical protein